MLVHAAAGGVGSAAVQLAKAFGATVIGTAGTDEKVELCRSLGSDYGVNTTAPMVEIYSLLAGSTARP